MSKRETAPFLDDVDRKKEKKNVNRNSRFQSFVTCARIVASCSSSSAARRSLAATSAMMMLLLLVRWREGGVLKGDRSPGEGIKIEKQ